MEETASRSRQATTSGAASVRDPEKSPTAGRLPGSPNARSWGPPAGNAADPNFWRPVDDVYHRLLETERVRDPHPWLLTQTLVTSVSRRALYQALQLRPGSRVLDAGTGFGPVAVELAGGFGCRAVGVDADVRQLGSAASAVDALRPAGWLRDAPAGQERATVSLTAGMVDTLPFADGTFDAVVARFLLQHVDDPVATVSEFARVTRAGGAVCIVDVDDGLCLRYPDAPEPVRRLEDAYQQAQHDRGGDRTIGRKIAGMLDAAGFAVDHVLVLPHAAYNAASSPSGTGQRLVHERLSSFAGEFVERGILDAATVAEGLRVLANEALPAATVVDVHLGVVGHRRPSP